MWVTAAGCDRRPPLFAFSAAVGHRRRGAAAKQQRLPLPMAGATPPAAAEACAPAPLPREGDGRHRSAEGGGATAPRFRARGVHTPRRAVRRGVRARARPTGPVPLTQHRHPLAPVVAAARPLATPPLSKCRPKTGAPTPSATPRRWVRRGSASGAPSRGRGLPPPPPAGSSASTSAARPATSAAANRRACTATRARRPCRHGPTRRPRPCRHGPAPDVHARRRDRHAPAARGEARKRVVGALLRPDGSRVRRPRGGAVRARADRVVARRDTGSDARLGRPDGRRGRAAAWGRRPRRTC